MSNSSIVTAPEAPAASGALMPTLEGTISLPDPSASPDPASAPQPSVVNETADDDEVYHEFVPAEDRYYAVMVGTEPGVYRGTDDWSPYVEGIKGASAQRYPTREMAVEAYNQATVAKGVVRITPGRRTLNEGDLRNVPGIGNAMSAGGADQRWYAVIVGRVPGIYQTSREATANITGVSGGRSRRFGSMEAAREAFLKALAERTVEAVPSEDIREVLTALIV